MIESIKSLTLFLKAVSSGTNTSMGGMLAV